MRHGGVTIYDSTGDYQWYIPHVYDGEWKPVVPSIYDGSKWQMIGGAGVPYDYYLDSDGKYVLVSGGGYFLVPRDPDPYLVDTNNTYLLDSNGLKLKVGGV